MTDYTVTRSACGCSALWESKEDHRHVHKRLLLSSPSPKPSPPRPNPKPKEVKNPKSAKVVELPDSEQVRVMILDI